MLQKSLLGQYFNMHINTFHSIKITTLNSFLFQPIYRHAYIKFLLLAIILCFIISTSLPVMEL